MNMKDHINTSAKNFFELELGEKLGITLGDFVLDPHYWYAKNRERIKDILKEECSADASTDQ